MSILTRLRGSRLALFAGVGMVVILVLSIAAVALIPTTPDATPAPSGSPGPAPSATPIPADECTPGSVAGPTASPGSEPTATPVGSAPPSFSTRVLEPAELPFSAEQLAAAGAFTVSIEAPPEQELTLALNGPNGETATSGPGAAPLVASINLAQPGIVTVEVASSSGATTGTILEMTYLEVVPVESAAPSSTPRPSLEPTKAGAGDRCSYVSVYVHTGAETTPLDSEVSVVAKRITLFSDPNAASIDVPARRLADGGWSLPVTSGASWRLLVDGQRVFDREAARESTSQFCPEIALSIIPGQARRFVFEVFPTSELVTCPGPVALIDAEQAITPDIAPTPPPVLLNPVRLGVETGQVLRYRPDLIAYQRSLEETNSSISLIAAIYFLVGVGGMILFGSFAIWLLFGAQDLGATKDTPTTKRRRRRQKGAS